MGVSAAPLSNGYNMVGTTALTPTFSASTKLGASVKSYTFTVEGKSYSTAPYTSAALTQGGWQTVTGTVTDTRGFTATVSERIWVMAAMPSLSVSGSTYLDRAIGCNFTPANKDAYSRLILARKSGDGFVDFKTIDVGQKPSNTTESVTIGTDELVSIYEAFPNTADVPLRIRLLTYQDAYSTKIEETAQDITLKIPENDDTKPRITSIEKAGHPTLLGNSGLFVKGKNGVRVTASGEGRYKSSIASIWWKVGESEFGNGDPSGIFAEYGTIPIIVYVLDTRGFQNSTTENITVSDYTKPLLVAADGKSNILADRVSDGDKDYLYIAAKRTFSSLGGYNACVLKCRKKQYRQAWETTYTVLIAGTSITDNYDQKTDIELSRDSTYTIELSVTDDFGESDVYTIGVATEEVYMDRSGSRKSIAFGGHVTEDNAFEVYQKAFFRAGMYFDDLDSGKRYRVKIGTDGNIRAVEEKTTFNLRR
jgi:hypothetical protein